MAIFTDTRQQQTEIPGSKYPGFSLIKRMPQEETKDRLSKKDPSLFTTWEHIRLKPLRNISLKFDVLTLEEILMSKRTPG